jgi:uncharacterized protein with HEPN domain
MPSFDGIRMRHMREAAAAAVEMAAGHDRPELSRNVVLAMALTRCLEILGEAASKVSPETRLRFSAIPFVKIVSMRNRLIHAYFDVDLDVVWTTVSEDLPALLPALDAALSEIDR